MIVVLFQLNFQGIFEYLEIVGTVDKTRNVAWSPCNSMINLINQKVTFRISKLSYLLHKTGYFHAV